MQRWTKRLALAAVWFLLLILPALSYWGPAAQASELAGTVMPVQYQDEQTRGALDFRIQSDEGAPWPPGELLLSDPLAQMTGGDATGYRYQEIPNSAYRRVSGAYHLHVGDAASGRYSLRVYGKDYGKYILYMTGYDQNGVHADLSFTMLLEPGEVHYYLIDYSNVAGARIKARRIMGPK